MAIKRQKKSLIILMGFFVLAFIIAVLAQFNDVSSTNKLLGKINRQILPPENMNNQLSPYKCEKVLTQNFIVSNKDNQNIIENLDHRLAKTNYLLKQKLGEFKSSHDGNRKVEVLELLKKRKELMVEALYYDPVTTLQYAADQNFTRDLIALGMSNCIEQMSSLEGVVEIYHTDFFDEQKGTEEYALMTNDGRKIELFPVAGFDVRGGDHVQIQGYTIDDKMVFSSAGSRLGKIIRLGRDDLPVVGPQKTIVILSYFQNTPQPDFTKQDARTFIFDELNKFYKENSYDKISVVGEVAGWYQLPIMSSDCQEIDQRSIEAADRDINFRQFSRIIIFSPHDRICGRGHSSVGKLQVMTNDGIVYLSLAAMPMLATQNLNIAAHEFGHSLNLHHATFYDCEDASFKTKNCSWMEYGDPYSVMGISRPYHFNGLHKENMKWFNPTQLKEVKTSGTYTLSPLETGNGLQVVKTPYLAASLWNNFITDYVFLEFRQPIGYDQDLDGSEKSTNDIFKGALVHVSKVSLSTEPNRSLLIDTTPPANNKTTTIGLNQKFTIPLTSSTIKTVGLNKKELTVELNIKKTDFTPPKVVMTTPEPDSVIKNTATVSAQVSDESGISKVEFYISNDICYYLHLYSNCRYGKMLQPFAVLEKGPYTAAFDSTHLVNGENYIWVVAYDKSVQIPDTIGNFTIPAIVPVTIANTDAVPPEIISVSPKDGDIQYFSPTFKAEARDNIGIARVRFFIRDEEMYADDFDEPYSYTHNVPLTPGEHTLEVIAEDLVGNQTIRKVTFISVDINDTEGPTVRITYPTDSSLITESSLNIQVEATDQKNFVKNVVVYIYDSTNKKTLLGEDDTAPYTFLWNTDLLTNGDYNLAAEATDIVDNVGKSPLVTVTVNH